MKTPLIPSHRPTVESVAAVIEAADHHAAEQMREDPEAVLTVLDPAMIPMSPPWPLGPMEQEVLAVQVAWTWHSYSLGPRPQHALVLQVTAAGYDEAVVTHWLQTGEVSDDEARTLLGLWMRGQSSQRVRTCAIQDSVSTLTDQMEDASRRVRRRQSDLDEARAVQHELVRQALASGRSAYQVAQDSGLSQPTVARIRDAK